VLIRLSTFALALMLASTTLLAADESISPKPQGAEVAFVTNIQKDLMTRFPTAKDAENAGYFRYTNEDHTGAISYANTQWQSADAQHPSQLWYDVHGKLLGADFSVLSAKDSKTGPSLWGINPKRWEAIPAHIHYVIVDANKTTYGGMRTAKFTGAGGDLINPQAATLVKLGLVKSADDVKHVFLFPAIWDLIVWVLPNPNGAFAEMNPNVKPSKKGSDMDM